MCLYSPQTRRVQKPQQSTRESAMAISTVTVFTGRKRLNISPFLQEGSIKQQEAPHFLGWVDSYNVTERDCDKVGTTAA